MDTKPTQNKQGWVIDSEKTEPTRPLSGPICMKVLEMSKQEHYVHIPSNANIRLYLGLKILGIV